MPVCKMPYSCTYAIVSYLMFCLAIAIHARVYIVIFYKMYIRNLTQATYIQYNKFLHTYVITLNLSQQLHHHTTIITYNNHYVVINMSILPNYFIINYVPIQLILLDLRHFFLNSINKLKQPLCLH